MAENDILLFDGDCGFCQDNILRIDKFLGSNVTVLPYQKFDFSQARPTRKDAESALLFIDSGSHYYLGSEAFSKWLRTGKTLYQAFGLIMTLPGFSQSGKILYKFISKHKSHLSRHSQCLPASQ